MLKRKSEQELAKLKTTLEAGSDSHGVAAVGVVGDDSVDNDTVND